MWVGVSEEAVRREGQRGGGEDREVLTCRYGKRMRCPAPLYPALGGIRLSQQLGRSFRTSGGHLCPDLMVWRFEKIFFGLPVALPASDFLDKFLGVSGWQYAMRRGERI